MLDLRRASLNVNTFEYSDSAAFSILEKVLNSTFLTHNLKLILALSCN